MAPGRVVERPWPVGKSSGLCLYSWPFSIFFQPSFPLSSPLIKKIWQNQGGPGKGQYHLQSLVSPHTHSMVPCRGLFTLHFTEVS